MTPPPRRCPATPARNQACPERPACPADPAATLPRDGAERAVMLALRFVAAAAETGDAACFDAAFDAAEAAFGPRDGALLVARAAALVRALRWDDAEPRFLPPPCRSLSPDEAHLLAALRPRLSGGRDAGPDGLSAAARAALADLAVPVRTVALGLPLLPPAAPPPLVHATV